MFERVFEKGHGHPCGGVLGAGSAREAWWHRRPADAILWHRHPLAALGAGSANDSSAASRCHYLIWACALSLILAGGCERTATTTQPPVQTVGVDHLQRVPNEPPKLAAPAPLLLEDEPAGGASNGPGADNNRCFVCHVNYMQEKLATTHARANIGCAGCHGPSDAHIADESWASGGNGTAPDRMYTRDKINASCTACHPKDKIDTPQHMAVLADTEGTKVCTHCHGNHRLPQRRCTWK